MHPPSWLLISYKISFMFKVFHAPVVEFVMDWQDRFLEPFISNPMFSQLTNVTVELFGDDDANN